MVCGLVQGHVRDGDLWYFDRFAPIYDALVPSADRERLSSALDRAERDVNRVVDVGGGTGRAINMVDAPERVVLDASAEMLARVPRVVTAVRGSATELPLRDESTDAVLVVDALHHMPRQRTVLRDAARILELGGLLVVRQFDRSSRITRLLELGEHAIGMRSRFRSADDIADGLRGLALDAEILDRGVTCTVIGLKPSLQ